MTNSRIKVSELFYSIQGEGLLAGTPSVFLRTFGCNFSCAGFGMPKGELSQERLKVDPSLYNNYKELPLVHTGCDSYASWDPRFKHLSPLLEVDAIVNEIEHLLPGGRFNHDKHLIITGGEPLLGWQKQYPELLSKLIEKLGLSHLTFETNGTQPILPELEEFFTGLTNLDITFSVSAKLPGSGEAWDKAIRPDIVRHYNVVSSLTYLKFVISNPEDLADVEQAVAEYNIDIPVYLMPAGGTVEGYQSNERWVADLCAEKGYRFSPRLQVPLYKNAWGT